MSCAAGGIHQRGEHPQAEPLEQWLAEVLQTYGDVMHELTGCGVQLLNPIQGH